jgi:hypothetical protein
LPPRTALLRPDFGREKPSSRARHEGRFIHIFEERCISGELPLPLCPRQALYRRPASDKLARTLDSHGLD